MVRKKQPPRTPVVAKPLNDAPKRNIVTNFVTKNIDDKEETNDVIDNNVDNVTPIVTESEDNKVTNNVTLNNTNEVTNNDINNITNTVTDIVDKDVTKDITLNSTNSVTNNDTIKATKDIENNNLDIVTNNVTDQDTNNKTLNDTNNSTYNDTNNVTDSTIDNNIKEVTKNVTKKATRPVPKNLTIIKSITLGKKEIVAKFTSNKRSRPNYNLSEDTIEKIEKISDILGYKKAEFLDIYLNGTLTKILKSLEKNMDNN